MFKKILVPTDGSGLSGQAVAAAVKFAAQNGSSLVALAVVESLAGVACFGAASGVDMQKLEREIVEEAQKGVDAVAALARESGVSCEGLVVRGAHPYEEIVNVAAQSNCDVIFMASHGRKGVEKLFLGSQTQKVLALSNVPVLVFR